MGKLPNLIIGTGPIGINIEDKNEKIQVSDNDVNCVMIPTEAIGPLIRWLQTKTESQKKTLEMVLTQKNGVPQFVVIPNNDVLAAAHIIAQKFIQFDKQRQQKPDEFHCDTSLNLEIAETAQKYRCDIGVLEIIINDLRTKLEKGLK
jgi:hypothetical protein